MLQEDRDISNAEARATIAAQNTRAHEMSADINRLTHTVRELQEQLKKQPQQQSQMNGQPCTNCATPGRCL